MAEWTGEQIGRVNLARAAPFALGQVSVHPGTRQVRQGDRSETLEPRVMQVLVAFAEAKGKIVTRDDLIFRCWGGRVVGDNAIQRVISRLRELASDLAKNSFRFETINKVGYRLIVLEGEYPRIDISEATAEREMADAYESGVETQLRRRAGISADSLRLLIPGAIGLLAIICAVFITVFWDGASAPGPSRIAIVGNLGETDKTLSHSLAVELTRLTQQVSHRFVVSEGNAEGANFYVEAAITRSGQRIRGATALRVAGTSDVLWSTSVERPLEEMQRLAEQLAMEIAQVILCAMPASEALDSDSVRLLISACTSSRLGPSVAGPAGPHGLAVSRLRQLTARAPNYARGWALLAIAETELQSSSLDKPQGEDLLAAAKEHWQRARSLDPDNPESFFAEAVLFESSEWNARLKVIAQGLALDNTYAPLHELRARVFSAAGYRMDAIEAARLATNFDKASPAFMATFISTLAYGGFLGAALREIDSFDRMWPGSPWPAEVRQRLEIRFGDPKPLIRIINDDGSAPDGYASYEWQRGELRAFLVARAEPTPANVDAAVALMTENWRRSKAPQFYIQLLGQFDRLDAAFAVLSDKASLAQIRGATEILFRPHMRSIRHDKRFMVVAARLGLVDFWQSRNRWPDFCSDSELSYDCESEAAKALAQPAD